MSDDENPYVIGPSPYDEETLRRLYYDEGLTLNEMADELDRGVSTVSSWMDDFGIERKATGPTPNLSER
jgi:transposase